MSLPTPRGRVRRLAGAGVLAGLCLIVADLGRAAEPAPAPRPVQAAEVKINSPADLDKALIEEIKARSEQMKNLQYLSDVIGPRLTGSKNLERANNWTAEKMKEYGLENVRLETWEIPYGWERGTASMKIVEPATNTQLYVASAAWGGSTNGKVTGPVVILKARTKEELAPLKGKLKNAVILTSPPGNVAPVTDLRYGPITPSPLPKKDDKADDAKKDEAKKEVPKTTIKDEACGFDEQPPAKDEQPPKKGDQPPPKKGGGGGFGGFGVSPEVTDFLRAEGVACTISDSGKPHGLVVTGGRWQGERPPTDAIPRLYTSHEHYSMLWRLASRPDAETKVEVEISNKFVPGPITVYNTVGEIKGSEKPDEFVVVGAHLDSWDLGSGTTDNGTGSTVVLEVARAIAALAKQGHKPKRTIRFVLFTGEEQGLLGSRQYTVRHKETMNKHSIALVHDTGTGKVLGFGVQGKEGVKKILEPELVTLNTIDGWRGLDMGGQGGTDHLSFIGAGVPGMACRQDPDEYRLTHHTQTDTFDHAKEPNLIQGAQIMAVTAMRVANLPDLLPRN